MYHNYYELKLVQTLFLAQQFRFQVLRELAKIHITNKGLI